MRVFLSKEGDSGPATQYTVADNATGADLLRESGLGNNYVAFDYDGGSYSREEFAREPLIDRSIVFAAATKATNG